MKYAINVEAVVYYTGDAWGWCISSGETWVDGQNAAFETRASAQESLDEALAEMKAVSA